jgi:hypothetical protein
MAGRHGVPVLLWVHGRRDRPVDTIPVPEHDADFPVDRQARLQPDHRPGRRGHQVPERSECGRAREAVLSLLRPWRHALAAPADQGMDREIQRQIRHGLGEAARADLRQPEAAWGHSGKYQADAVAGCAPEVGLAFLDSKKALRARGRGVCRVRRLYRPRDRPRDPAGPGYGQARQHTDHLHQRRQRHQRRGHPGGHL